MIVLFTWTIDNISYYTVSRKKLYLTRALCSVSTNCKVEASELSGNSFLTNPNFTSKNINCFIAFHKNDLLIIS